MSDSISIARLMAAIMNLPGDEPIYDLQTWYITQKQHWLGWLREYHGPGAYGRRGTTVRDAGYAYNHIVNPQMLLWLIDAAGVEPKLVKSARRDSAKAGSMPGQSAAIRRVVPWAAVADALWRRK